MVKYAAIAALAMAASADAAFVGSSSSLQGLMTRQQLPASSSSAAVRSSRPDITLLKAEAGDVSRRGFMTFAAASAVALSAPNPALAKKTSATAEDVVASYKNLIAIQTRLDAEADDLVAKKDWKALDAMMESPEFKNVENDLLKLVNGPVLSAEDKKTIGTRKRYGIAADVIYGVGGIQSAVKADDDPQLQACVNGQCSGDFVSSATEVPKALKGLRNALKEIITICSGYKELKK